MCKSKRLFVILVSLLSIIISGIDAISEQLEFEPITNPIIRLPKVGQVHSLVIFAAFQDDPQGSLPSWAGNLFQPDVNNSIRHYFNVQSNGQHTLTGCILNHWYYAVYNHSPLPTARDFTFSILQQVDQEVNFSQYDNLNNQSPYNPNPDGIVDQIFLIIANNPYGSINGLVGLYEAEYITNDTWFGAEKVKINMGSGTQEHYMTLFENQVGIMAHEYAHQLGLPDLYDDTYNDPNAPPAEFSAGIGFWCLMSEGYGLHGLYPISEFCKYYYLEQWITTLNITSTTLNFTLASGTIYKIKPTNFHNSEYFLICFRDHNNFYNQKLQNGLLIFHYDGRELDNYNELHKRLDLESADGLFTDKGFPGGIPNPISGGDNLDFWAKPEISQANADYTANHNGNTHDNTDPFDGVTYTSFTPYTNPNSNGYNGNIQTKVSQLAITWQNGIGNVYFNYWEGSISTNTTWTATNGPYYVGGDLTVNANVTFTIQPGTVIKFIANQDACHSGRDINRSELTVYGKLEAEGAIFSATSNSKDAWYGIILDNADDNSYIRNSVIEFGVIGVLCLNLNTTNTAIQNNIFRYCNWQAIWIDHSNPDIYNNLIENGYRYGIYIANSSPYIHKNTVRYHANYALFCNHSVGGYIRENIIHNNLGGVRCADGASPLLIGKSSNEYGGKNKIYNNSWWGVCPSDYSHPDVGLQIDANQFNAAFNCIYDNTQWQIKNLTSSMVYAYNNYWKIISPSFSGNVAYVPYLTTPPLNKSIPDIPEIPSVTLANQSDILKYLTKGHESEGQGDFETAINCYRWVIDNQPENEWSIYALARLMACRIQQGEESLEEKYLTKLSFQSNNEILSQQAWLWQPVVLAKSGKYSEAIQLSNNLTAAKDGTEMEKDLLFQLAMLYYYEINNFRAARETLDSFVQQFPEDQRSQDIKNLDFLFAGLPSLPRPQTETNKTDILPVHYRLALNYPNPFNTCTNIYYELPELAVVTITIHNLLGQKVTYLVNESQSGGKYQISWNGKNTSELPVGSGIYFCRFFAQGITNRTTFQQTLKLIYLQ